MRILFLGDYSNLHACLAKELRKRGHEITVVSDGGRYMDTSKDILLDRKPGLLGTAGYAMELLSHLPSFRGYDVVQLINPHFLSLRPAKLLKIFKWLLHNNHSVFLTLAGNDYQFCKTCLDGKTFRFSEFLVGDKETDYEQTSGRAKAWTTPEMRDYGTFLYDHIDGAMSVLPEYDIAARPYLGEKLTFTNLPVDLSGLPFSTLDISGPINLFIGMRSGMEIQKGTAKLLAMCKDLQAELPDKCSVTCVSNLPLKDYISRMKNSHIVLDQLYSYSPGTNGFQAMALGRVAATGSQPEFYRYIGEDISHPIIPLSPLKSMVDWKEYFRNLILDPEPLIKMGENGRKLVERHNDVAVVAGKFENHWNKILK